MLASLDLTNLWSFINTAAAPAGVIVFGWAVSEVRTFLRVKSGSQAQDDLDQAMQHGENLLVDWFKSVESHNGHVVVPSGTLFDVANKVLDLAPAAESLLGITPEAVGALLQARFTSWLHWQPTTVLTPGVSVTNISNAAPPDPEPTALRKVAPGPDPS